MSDAIRIPSVAEERLALIRAAAAGKRREWWAAERAAAAFDAERAKKTQGVLPLDDDFGATQSGVAG